MNQPTRTKYPIGIQDFEKLRTGGYMYIDKTAMVYQLAEQGGYYFLGRPRRFGKSLLISTLEAYFLGKKHLFEGLAIEKMEKEWKQYPVLHLDLNASVYNTPEDLEQMLGLFLSQWEKLYGSEPQEKSVSARFAGVVRRACEQTGQPVVILVDEYDKPLAVNFGNEELLDQYRLILKAFYGVLKSCYRYIKIGFLTGVTNISKVSVFCDLNNLDDISMWDKYISVCGITEQELRDNLDAEIGLLAEKQGMTKEACYAEMKRRYDGYHFRQNTPGIYNPYSVIHTLNKQEFGYYWVESGTPTLLMKLLQQSHFNLNKLTEEEISATMLGSLDTIYRNPVPVIYQSGYLTIKGYDPEFRSYQLGFPNEEVEHGFMEFLLPHYSCIGDQEDTVYNISQFVREVRRGQTESFMRRLQTMTSDTSYQVVGESELYFQNVLFLFFRLVGLYTEVERPTSDGRMDMVVKTKGYVYIFEFKIDKTADEALRQIEDKHYADAFLSDARTLYKIGVSFDSKKRCIAEYKIL